MKPARRAALLIAAALLWGPGDAPVPSAAAEQADAKSSREGVYTTAQAERGRKLFSQRCASCHPAEKFREPSFLATWQGQTAHALFTNIRTTMPQENPGGLRRQDYADLLAYLLQVNKLPAGAEELSPTDEALKRIRIEPVK